LDEKNVEKGISILDEKKYVSWNIFILKNLLNQFVTQIKFRNLHETPKFSIREIKNLDEENKLSLLPSPYLTLLPSILPSFLSPPTPTHLPSPPLAFGIWVPDTQVIG
jgi:hypothetical protein